MLDRSTSISYSLVLTNTKSFTILFIDSTYFPSTGIFLITVLLVISRTFKWYSHPKSNR